MNNGMSLTSTDEDVASIRVVDQSDEHIDDPMYSKLFQNKVEKYSNDAKFIMNYVGGKING